MLAGILSSCKHYPTAPPHPCDTCKPPCDTCDTTHPPCDTCNIDKDSAAHAFNWTEYTLSDESSMTGVAVFGPNSIYVFGNNLHIYDGTTWKTTTSVITGTSIQVDFIDMNVFAFTANDYWVTRGNILLNGDENVVTQYRFTSGPIHSLNASWGTSSNDMFFVGDTGITVHYDGTTFTKMPRVTTKNLRKVWGTSHNNVWASGWNQTTGESVLIHYDGNVWKEIDLSKLGDIGPGSNGLISVWTIDSAGHNITVAGGSFVYRTTDNSNWRPDTVGNSLNGGGYVGLNNIRGNSSIDFMVEGGGGFVTHWNGKTWKLYKEIFDWNSPSFDSYAFSFKGNTACVVGTKNGTGWVAIGRRK